MYLSVLIKKCTLASCKKGPRSWEERGGVGRSGYTCFLGEHRTKGDWAGDNEHRLDRSTPTLWFIVFCRLEVWAGIWSGV